MEDDVRTGRPQAVRTERKIEEVAMLVRAAVGVSLVSAKKILTDDLTCRVLRNAVPRILTQDQRDDRMTICGGLISTADDNPTFLTGIIIGDETWCFLYDLRVKRQSAIWKTPMSPRQDR